MIKNILKKLLLKLTDLKWKFYLLNYSLINDNKVFTHLTTEEKIILHQTVKTLNSKKRAVCVEIGSYLGASSCFIANALNNNSVLYCIDTWGNDAMIYTEEEKLDENLIKKDTLDAFLLNSKKYLNKIKLLRGWSYVVAPDLKAQESEIDFIFIDGDHEYAGVKKDWETYKAFMKKGTLIALHDTGWADGVKQVIKEDIAPIASVVHALPNMLVVKLN